MPYPIGQIFADALLFGWLFTSKGKFGVSRKWLLLQNGEDPKLSFGVGNPMPGFHVHKLSGPALHPSVEHLNNFMRDDQEIQASFENPYPKSMKPRG